MSDTDRAEIYVTLFKGHPDETRLRLFLPGDGWNFEEGKVAKNVSEGMSPAQIEGGLLEGDPDAWLAVLRVSYMRAEKEFPAQRIMGEDVIELMTELAKETREAMKRRPPTSANGNESGVPTELATIGSPEDQS